MIQTSVLADLGYLERKLNRAAALLKEPEKALAQLTLAQSRAIEFVVNKSDDPLVRVQHALRLAERMVEEGKHEAAQDNLRVAQIQLGTYRALLGKEAGKVRSFWGRAVSLFREEPGQAHVVEKDSSEKVEKATEAKK
ncbi:MAG: hypothetical protein AMJ65_13935 [Phycisphaerae bacterium SG8_4]|nr:MAG: hypothetical protein AMJ65_13935 [Phycisphaerae bacterium SG8_4]